MNLQGLAINQAYLGLFAVAGRAVSYSRSDAGVAAVSAVVGKSQQEASTEFGVMLREVRDYIIKSADLVLIGSSGSSGAGELITPAPGDTITDMGFVWEVIQLVNGDCSNNADPDNIWCRIHTQQL